MHRLACICSSKRVPPRKQSHQSVATFIAGETRRCAQESLYRFNGLDEMQHHFKCAETLLLTSRIDHTVEWVRALEKSRFTIYILIYIHAGYPFYKVLL